MNIIISPVDRRPDGAWITLEPELLQTVITQAQAPKGLLTASVGQFGAPSRDPVDHPRFEELLRILARARIPFDLHTQGREFAQRVLPAVRANVNWVSRVKFNLVANHSAVEVAERLAELAAAVETLKIREIPVSLHLHLGPALVERAALERLLSAVALHAVFTDTLLIPLREPDDLWTPELSVQLFDLFTGLSPGYPTIGSRIFLWNPDCLRTNDYCGHLQALNLVTLLADGTWSFCENLAGAGLPIGHAPGDDPVAAYSRAAEIAMELRCTRIDHLVAHRPIGVDSCGLCMQHMRQLGLLGQDPSAAVNAAGVDEARPGDPTEP